MLKSEVSASDKFLQPKIFILLGTGFLSPCAAVKSCSEPSRRNSEYFRRRAVVQKHVFLGEKRVSNRIILPGTCWNKNDNFRIFKLVVKRPTY